MHHVDNKMALRLIGSKLVAINKGIFWINVADVFDINSAKDIAGLTNNSEVLNLFLKQQLSIEHIHNYYILTI